MYDNKNKSNAVVSISLVALILLFSLPIASAGIVDDFLDLIGIGKSKPIAEQYPDAILQKDLVTLDRTPTSNSNVEISDGWRVIRATGNEENFDVHFLNAKDKKTEICFTLKEGINPTTSNLDLTAKTLYNQDGTPILNDKDKTITIKYESSKCDGKDGYHISLTEAQAVNIDDYIKLGQNSLVLEYQEGSRIHYQYDWGSTDITLYKDGEINEDIFVYADESRGWKFGANDSSLADGELANYTYVISSTATLGMVERDVEYTWVEQISVKNETQEVEREVTEQVEVIEDGELTGEIVDYTYNITVLENVTTEWANVTHTDINYSYPKFYNYYPNNFNEARHWFDFQDICSKPYANCEWVIEDNSAIINFQSDKFIDPTISNVSECATLNDFNTTYILNQSITGIVGDCFIINNDSITLDLNGFEIEGDGQNTGVSVTGFSNTTIENGDISNFSSGVYLDTTIQATAQNLTIISEHTPYGCYGFEMSTTGFTTLYDNFVTCKSDGLWFTASGTYANYNSNANYSNNVWWDMYSDVGYSLAMYNRYEEDAWIGENYGGEINGGQDFDNAWEWSNNLTFYHNNGNTGEGDTTYYMYYSTNVSFINNIGVGSGIWLEALFPQGYFVDNNTVYADVWGVGDFGYIETYGSGNLIYYNHTITTNNTIDGAVTLYNFQNDNVVLNDTAVGWLYCYDSDNHVYRNLTNAPSLDMTYCDNFTIDGYYGKEGANLDIAFSDNGSLNDIQLPYTDRNNGFELSITDNISITNTNINGTSYFPMYLNKVTNSKFENITASGMEGYSSGVYILYLDNSSIKNISSDKSYQGLTIRYSDNFTIDDFYINNNGTQTALEVGYSDGLVIENGIINGTYSKGIYMISSASSNLKNVLLKDIALVGTPSDVDVKTYSSYADMGNITLLNITGLNTRDSLDTQTLMYNTQEKYAYYTPINVTTPDGTPVANANITIVGNTTYCFQDEAYSDICGGGGDGYYSSPAYYFRMNYEKPTGATNNSEWIVNHGNLGTYSITLPQHCWEGNATHIKMRFYSNVNGNPYDSYPQCYNGTGWTTIGSTANEGGWNGYLSYAQAKLYDERVYVADSSSSGGTPYSGQYSRWVYPKPSDGGGDRAGTIQEEGMLWAFDNNTQTITTDANGMIENQTLLKEMYLGDHYYNLSEYNVSGEKDGYFPNSTIETIEGNQQIHLVLSTTNPTFTNYREDPAEPFNWDNETTTHYFNVTIDYTNGTAGINFQGIDYGLDSAFFHSGGGNEYFSNWTDLAPFNWSYYYWAWNEAGDTVYYSDNQSYLVDKGIPILSISGTTPITYGTITDVIGGGCPTGDYPPTCSLSPSNDIFGVEVSPVLFNYSTSGNTYYHGASASMNITINPADTLLTLTSNQGWTTYAGVNVTITGGNCSAGSTCNLYNESGVQSNPFINNFTVGSYYFEFNTTGNANYTTESINNTLIIVNAGSGEASECLYTQYGYYNEHLPFIKREDDFGYDKQEELGIENCI